MKKQTRSQARDAAFTQVFQMNMHEDDMDVILEELLNARPECETNLGYIRQIIDGVKEHESELEDTVAVFESRLDAFKNFKSITFNNEACNI